LGSRIDGLCRGGLAVAAGSLLLAATWLPAADVATDQVAGFMRAKLAHSQNVLEGLATEDFDLIERGAQELSLASLDSNWQVLQTEDYVRQSAEFRRACDSLRAAAQAKNLDGATVAWMDVTLKCVQCHKYVRDAD
jgi:cytochrome c556